MSFYGAGDVQHVSRLGDNYRFVRKANGDYKRVYEDSDVYRRAPYRYNLGADDLLPHERRSLYPKQIKPHVNRPLNSWQKYLKSTKGQGGTLEEKAHAYRVNRFSTERSIVPYRQ